jgi:hypothetical protein
MMMVLCEPKHVRTAFIIFNYLNNLRILQFVCIYWIIKCLKLLMHGATVKFMSQVFTFCIIIIP